MLSDLGLVWLFWKVFIVCRNRDVPHFTASIIIGRDISLKSFWNRCATVHHSTRSMERGEPALCLQTGTDFYGKVTGTGTTKNVLVLAISFDRYRGQGGKGEMSILFMAFYAANRANRKCVYGAITISLR